MIYYYENEIGQIPECGNFKAENDIEALTKMPQKCCLLYCENNTKDGTPFKILYEKEDEK